MVKETAFTGQLRLVNTTEGPITYQLIRKKIKNMNLRVTRDGQVTLSVPMRCSLGQGDDLIRAKSGWIMQALNNQTENLPVLLPEPTRQECYLLLLEAVERVYPLVAPLGVVMPELKIRTMKSQWGNCHWRQGYITLNTALGRCPAHLRDYVALHELVHFLHHDHGAGFYASMDRLMPQWRSFRKELKDYSAALN